MFGRHESRGHAISLVRDVVEILAIIAAGIWAFYVFAYENHIKPSLAQPDVNISASMQRLSEHNGLISIRMHVVLHNIGTVHAHFLGLAVNVSGHRVIPSKATTMRLDGKASYGFAAFYHLTPGVPVVSTAYVTRLGDPSSTQDTELDPGTTVENDGVFYVPRHRFDLLTAEVDAVYTKYEDAVIPTRLEKTRSGAVRVVTTDAAKTNSFDVDPVTVLDLSP